MADGRKIPYIIEMIADDSQLRKQMKGWDWEDIMGSKGKGFADILGQEGKEAKEKIKKELGGLNIDWEKIFGSKKHMQQFEQGLARVLTKSHKALSALASDDAEGLQKIIDYVAGLGEVFKSFGSDFKVDALTRNMGAFMKVFSSDKISKMTNNMDAFAGALDRVFGKDLTRSATNTGEAVNKVARALSTLGTDRSALNSVKQIRAELEKAVQNTKIELEIDYDKLDNATLEKKLRDKLKISAKDSIDLEGLLTQEWDNQLATLEETQKLLHSLTGDQTKYAIESAKLIPILKNILSLGKKAEELTGYSWLEGYSVSNFADESAIREEIRDIIATLNEELDKSKKQLQKATETLVSGLGNVNIKLKLDDADKASFEKSINDYIAKLNSTSNINDVKIGVKVKDDGGLSDEEIEEKIKRAKEWRRQIVNALNAEKEDMPLYFGTKAVAESLYNELQEYFEANEIDIRLNKDIIVQQLKQAIEEGGLPAGGLGGGTISLDPKTLASAVATGLQGFFTGDFKPVTGEKKTVKEVQEKPKKTFYLDPQNEYNQEVAKTFKEILSYALADGNPNKKVKGFFEDKLVGSDFWDEEAKSVNLERLVGGSSIGLVEALSYITEKYGETLVDDFNQLIKDVGKNKLLTNFKGDLSELLKTQNIKQITGDEHIKDLQRKDLWDDYVLRGRLTSGLGKLRANPDDFKIPEVEELESLIKLTKDENGVIRPQLKEVSVALETLKTARADMTDVNNVDQKTEFLNVVAEFKDNTQEIYQTLSRYLKSFEWGIDVKGFKNRFGVQSASGVDRLWRAIGGDESRVLKPHLYRAPDSLSVGQGKLTEYRPDRTDVLYRDTKVKDFSPRENTSKKWEEPTATKEAIRRSEQAIQQSKKLDKAISEYETDRQSLEKKRDVLQSDIDARTEDIKATEKYVKEASVDGKKIAGARKRLQNREDAFERAEKQYNELEQARLDAIGELLDAKESQETIESQDYRDIDYADEQIRKFDEQLKNPLKYRKDMIGTFEVGEDGTNRLKGGVYQDAYNNNRYYRDLAKEKAKNAKIQYERLVKEEDNLRAWQTKAANEGDVDEVDRIEKEIQENRKRIVQYKTDERNALRDAEKHQQEIVEILRKRNGTSKQDKADFARDAKEYAKNQISIAKQNREQYGEDPRVTAKARTQQAEAIAQITTAQTNIAKTKLDKAQRELDSIQNDEFIKKVKDIDEKKEWLRLMKETNERQSKEVAEIDQKMLDNEAKKPQKISDALNSTSTDSNIDKLIEDANKAQENLDATIAEAKQIEQWVDDAIGAEGYKKPEYDIKRTKKDQSLFDKSLTRRKRATYLSNIADDTFGGGEFVPEDLSEEMTEVINSIIDNREILQKLSSDFGFDKFTTEDELRKEAQRRLTDSENNKINLPPIIQEYYKKIVDEGRDMASQWLNQTLEAAKTDIETQRNQLQSFAEADTTIVQALKPKLNEADAHLRETYQKKVTSWFNAINKKMKIVEKGETEGATEEAKRAGALAAKEIEGIYALINRAIREYTTYFSTPDFARKMADLSIKYAETPLTEEIKNDPIKRREVEAKNKAMRAQLDQEKRKLKKEERETLEKELLSENLPIIEGRNRNLYSDYIAKITDSNQEQVTATHSAIESSERYNLLLVRQSELLAEISDLTLDGKSTDGLQQSLAVINEELLKYQQYLTNVSEDIIKMEQKAALDRALGVSKNELDKQYANIDKAYADSEKSRYDDLKKRQKDLLDQIKADTKEGKSTEALSVQLENINEELLKRETTQRRLEQFGASGDLYKADVRTVERYNELLEEQIRLEQELALIKARGEDASEKQKELRKKRNEVKNTVEQYQEGRIRGDAANSPYVQALDYLRETQDKYDTALQKRYAIKGRKSRIERQLDDIRNDEGYSTSWQYKRHQRDVKNELTTEYRYSDEYKADYANGWEIARKNIQEYIEKSIRTIVEASYKVNGRDIDDEDTRKKIEDEIDQRVKETKYRLDQSLGKDGMTMDPSKMSEAFSLFSEGGWRGIRENIEREFEESPEYKTLIEERRNKRKEALDKEIAAIQQESEETISMIRNASEENYEPLKRRMDKISHADLDQMRTNFSTVLSDPKKTRNREAMIASLGNAARSAGATKEQRAELENELKSLGDSAIKDVRSWFDRFIPTIFPTGDELRNLARESLIFDTKQRAESRIAKNQDRYDSDRFYADSETENQMRERIDSSLRMYTARALESFELSVNDDKFLKEAGLSGEILNKFKTEIRENVYKLVENYASSLEVRNGVINGRNIREEVEQKLQNQVDILEEHSVEAEKDIANIEKQRRAAMRFGGIKTNEIADAEVLREQAVLEAKLTLEKERQRELTDQIARLEKEGVSSDELGKLGEALDKSNENIRKLEMFVANKDVLMDIQHQTLKDEKALEKFDLDQQKLYYEARKTAAEVDLESGNEKVRKSAEERLIRLNSIIERLDGKIAERDQAERDARNPIKMFASAIKEALGGQGSGLSVDATGLATEATLAQILATLTGGQVVEGSTRSEVAATITKKSPEWKAFMSEVREAYKKNTEKETKSPKEIDNTIKTLIEKVQDPKVDEKSKIALRVALKDALGDFASVNKDNKSLKYQENGRLPYEEMDKYFGLTEGTLKNLRLTNDQAKKLLGGQSIIAQPKTVEIGDGGVSTLARQDTLSKILEVLNSFKSNGVKVTGKKQGEVKEKTPKVEKTEAELIKERALKDKDAVLGIASSSKIKTKYESLVKELNAATELKDIKALAQKVSALGFNIKKESAEWDAKTTDASRVYDINNANAFGKRRDTVRKSMERLAQKQFNPDGKQYEFLDFDGTKLTYQLTDVRGNVEKVVMEWSELNNQVAITSDRSTSKLDTLANKVQLFGESFENAIDAGYLADNDKDLERFKNKVIEIQNEIAKGASFDDIDRLRNEALRIADEVTKNVNKVKKSYSSTTEINAATRQHDNMDARGILDKESIESVKTYNKAYSALIAKHKEFKVAGTLYDPENQATLQRMAINVRALGKDLESAQTRSEDLQQRVANSGLYNGKAIGEISQIARGTDVYEQMRVKLEELGATNIKVDRIHQRATGTIRHNSELVSDLEVSYDELTGSLARYHKQERESLTGVPAFLNGFKKKFNSIMQYLTMTMSIHQVIAQLRKGVQYIREIDLALTELRKVTDETEETYDKFLQTAAKTGSRLGATISAVTEATATFAKLGYTMKQATEMAEAAIVYKNVGDNIASTEDAADSIISTLKGFKLESSQTMAIVDKFNEVGNRFAITSQGIGEALRLSASALSEGGNSLDESIAMITAANEVVNDPSSVGTALKTLTLRLRGSKTELEEMGEDVSDMATTTSQLQSKLLALTGGQVDIMLDENTFKNSTQILREMADAWEDMTDIQRASALELMGGKRQANVLSALISNFDTVEEAIEASANSAGSALKENERYLDSIQGKIDQFNNAVQSMWSNSLDSDTIKGIVEIGTWLIKVIDKIGLFKSALIGLASYSMIKHKMGPITFFKSIVEAGTQGLKSLGDYAKGLKNISFETGSLYKATTTLTQAKLKEKLINTGLTDNLAEEIVAKTNLGKATDELSAATLDATLREKGYSKEKRESIIQSVFDTAATEANTSANTKNAASSVAAGAAEDKNSQDRMENVAATVADNTATETNTKLNLENATSNVKLGGSLKSLGANFKGFLKDNAITLAITAAVAIIAGAVALTNHLTETIDEAEDKFANLTNELDSTNTELDSLETQLDEINDRIKEINETTPLTFTDKEELDRLKAQTVELQRQKDLLETLQKQQALDANEAAIDMAAVYRDVGVDTGNTTEENMGTGAAWGAGTVGAGGAIGGALIGAKIGTAGSVGGPVGAAIGIIAGALIGAIVGALGGAGVGAAISANEEKVGESLDNMKEKYKELQSEFNEARKEYQSNPDEDTKEDFEEAQDAFNSYKSEMANYLTELNSAYNQIRNNWDVATAEQKAEVQAFDDQMDAWLIQSGSEDAKTNAINRIFGEQAVGGFAKARYEIDKLKENLAEAKKEGVGVDEALAELKDYKLNLSKEEVERLHAVGIYLYEIEDYFKEVIEAESEFVGADIYDVAIDINKITEGLENLKSAFDEIIERGSVTAKTITDLHSKFKEFNGTEDGAKAWIDYSNAVFSGASSIEQMTQATEEYVKKYLDYELAENNLNPENKWTYIVQLQGLGVKNAQEYVDELLESNMIKELEGSFEIDKEAVREAYEESTKDFIGPVLSFDTFDDEAIDNLAEFYGVVETQITATKQAVMERYGAEEEIVDDIIAKLKEKAKLEQDLSGVQTQAKEYDDWAESIKPIIEEIESSGVTVERAKAAHDAKLALEEYRNKVESMADKGAPFKDIIALRDASDFYNADTGRYEFDGAGFDSDAKLYEYLEGIINNSRIEEFRKELDSLWQIGIDKGYIIDGEVIDPDYQEVIDSVLGDIKNIDNAIKNLTPEAQLKLNLQNFDESVDKIQDVYSTLKDITTEYNTQGYLSLDNLQALLNLQPEYLACLQMEGGQLTINQSALETMLQTKLADAEATAVQTAITQLNALAERKQAIEISNSAVAANQATIELGTYSGVLGVVAQDAIVAAGSVAAFNAALSGAQGNTLVSEEEVNQVLANFNNSVELINGVRDKLPESFNNILDPGSKTSPEEVTDNLFQEAMDYWENRIGAEEARFEQIQHEIDMLESQGKRAGAGYYDRQIESENAKLELLRQQKEEAQGFLDEIIARGDEGSDQFWEVANTINDIEGEIDAVTASIQDLNDAMADTHWYVFDEAHDRISTLASDLENIRDILSNEKLFDDEGNFTEEGLGTLATYVQELGVFEGALANAKAEMELFGDAYDPNKTYVDLQGNNLSIDSEQDWYEAAQKAEEQYDEWNQKVIETRYNIKDLYEQQIDAVEEYTDSLIENYQDYIDAVKEALDAERDLFDFKKNINKQSKDIAAIERRIASLSGSTNKADIAERRKLEAELYDAKESLNDTYYDHAKQSQQTALDDEVTAYETAMNAYIEGLRTKLEESTADLYKSYEEMGTETQSFVDGVTQGVILNAGNVKEAYLSTGETINQALVTPWTNAANAIGAFASSEGALGVMNSWTVAKAGAPFYDFQSKVSQYLQKPWTSIVGAGGVVANFQTSIESTMNNIVQDVNKNVSNIISHLQTEIDKIKDTDIRVDVEYNVTGNGSGNNPPKVTITPGGGSSGMGFENMLNAKGTLGTKKDGLAITDESWIGEEITLAAGKNGQLQYLKKGSAIMPADISANLVEWGKINPNMLSASVNPNVNMISNAISKPEFNITFDSLVKAENITEETLPAVKKLVTQELNRFTKELNYALKGKGAR